MSATGPLDPDRVAATEFATSFRGYDTAEVRAFLTTVADALRAAEARELELRDQLGRAEHALRELRETARAEVEAAADEARREGREMVAEAQRVRERMLGDLARRRRHARQQVEQLMAGRERLLEAFDAARQTIDAATADMRGALPEARLAAEAAGRRFDHEGEPEEDEAVAALEGEIEAARLAGLPIVAPDEKEADGGEQATHPTRTEPSLLGERDVREMPPVELGADFEDVRIVPLEEPDGADEADAEGGAPADDGPVETAADAPADDEAPDREVVAGDDVVAGEDSPAGAEAVVETDAPRADDAPADDDDPGRAEGGAAEAADAVDGSPDEVEPEGATEGEDGASEAAAPVDQRHLDDLFAGLRAAREEAVAEARTVLADEGVTAEAAEAEPIAEPAAVAPEPTPEPPPPLPTGPLDVQLALGEAADGLGRAFKRVLGEQQNEVLDRLRRVRKGQQPVVADVLDDAGAMTERFAAVAGEPLGRLAAAAMASAEPDHRARPPAPGPMATAVATELAGPLHDRLARALADAGDAGEATAAARAAFREWKGQRVGALAADAARAAYHAGLLAGVGKGSRLVWSLDDADGACPECDDNALAGPVPRGDRYPTGHRHPPAHDGCRCLLLPVAEPADEPDGGADG